MNFKYVSYFLLTLLTTSFFSCSQKASGEQPQSTSPQTPTLIEVINGEDSLIQNRAMGVGLDTYTWKNHTVLFGDIEKPDSLVAALRNDQPQAEVKLYDKPLYLYDYQLHCADKYLTPAWTNYILTANLVEDTTLQQEYVDYHEMQFEEWPEVAQGFCNADFQQLMVYRNGRQLMLVISIPAGKILDELNPKTTENNPRMDEWNSLVGKYQEGIPGTAEGEVWVFLQ